MSGAFCQACMFMLIKPLWQIFKGAEHLFELASDAFHVGNFFRFASAGVLSEGYQDSAQGGKEGVGQDAGVA